MSWTPKQLGEFGLIDAIRRRAGEPGPPWRVGIGDDAAVLRPRAGYELVISTDALVEDVHFRWRTTDPLSLGHKSLEVNLSDVGAMGARPLGCLLTLGLPPAAKNVQLKGFVRGFLAQAKASGCPLVGGDTVQSPHWLVSVTVMGEAKRGQALRRSGARAGDRLMLTGEVGAAALGLQLLEQGRTRLKGAAPFLRRQRRPSPPYWIGAQLVRASLATAAIDLSDGLVQDAGRLLAESGLGADLHLERVPFARGLRRFCERIDQAPEPFALHGGEDYELLFTVRPSAPSADTLASRLGRRISEVGQVRRGRGLRVLFENRPLQVKSGGFDHFKPSR